MRYDPSGSVGLCSPTANEIGSREAFAVHSPMAAMTDIRLMIVDDHPLFPEGLAHTLGAAQGIVIAAQAASGCSALEQWRLVQPDVAIIDISMPGMDGIDTVRRLKAQDPRAKVLILTSSEEQDDIVATIDAGAQGYVTKSIRYADLVAAVRWARPSPANSPVAIATSP